MDLSPDLIVASNYRLERLLGSGSAGTVWKATDLSLGRPVALKVLRAELLRDEAQNERFRREARLLASLSHPALVTIYALINVEDEHGRVAPAIVMPFVAGRSMSDALRDGGAMPVARAAGYLRELLEALAAAHALGIVHRDLKPQNMLLEPRDGASASGTGAPADRSEGRAEGPLEEHIRLLDFGIARSTGGPVTSSSVVAASVGVMIGTPGYMSPEQIVDPAHVDGRADLWGAAVCFYEMLTLALPFEGATASELVGNVLAGAWRPARQVNPSLPVEVDVFFARTFHRQIAARPKDAAQMLEALAPVVAAAARGGSQDSWEPQHAPITAGGPAPSAPKNPATASSSAVGGATLLSGSMAAYLRPGDLTAPAPPSVHVSVKTLVSATDPSAAASSAQLSIAGLHASGQMAVPAQARPNASGQMAVPAQAHSQPPPPSHSAPRADSAPKPALPQVVVRIGDAPPMPLRGTPTQPVAPRPAVSPRASMLRAAVIAFFASLVLGAVGIGAFLLAQR